MKKLKLFLTLLMLLSVGVTQMWADDPDPVRSTFSKATNPADDQVTDLENTVTWDIATTVGAGSPSITTATYSQVEGLKFGSKAAEYFSKWELSTDYFEDYDYIVGDIAYSSLRLKGFYDDKNKKAKKINNFANLDDYLKKNCAVDCRYFVLKKKNEK